jgi:protein-S-isoprenylcysteine O-methyltransferase Ste14
LFVVVLFVVLVDRIFIKTEEEILEENFGEEFCNYKTTG